jgi:phage tail sheath gpL-like
MADVAFNNIPGNLLVPFFFWETNSGGTPSAGNARMLLVGQKTTAGGAAAGVPYGPIASETDAVAQFGMGSMLHTMYNIAVRNAPFQPVYALPLADPAGVAATGSININSGTALGVTGAAILLVMGRRVVVQINAADNAATTAAAIVAAINAANLPMTAAVDGTHSYQVNLTARHVGALGNAIIVKVATNEPNAITPTTAAVTALASGTGVPDLAAPLAALGDQEYDWIGAPYADTTSLNSVRDFLSDSAGRWSPIEQLFGHYTGVMFDTLSNLCTFGAGRNDQHVSIMGSTVSPTPPWEWAAALAAQEVQHLGTAPELSRPLQTLVLQGVLPPDDSSTRWDVTDRQALYSNGIGGYKVTVDGQVAIDRLVTTYQLSPQGVPDRTFLDIETMGQAMFVPRYMRNAVTNAHGRMALADDNPFGLSEICTVKDIRNTEIHAYNDLIALGVAENLPVFAANVVTVRNSSNPDRVDSFIPVDVVNQLRIFAGNGTYYQQFATASGQLSVPAPASS